MLTTGYKVDVNVGTLQTVGRNYITDIRTTTVDVPNGTTQARWVLFKIQLQIQIILLGWYFRF
jgi:hypothetical protein